MVIKYKLSDVAKDFNKQNKDIIDLLAKYIDGPKKKATNALEDKELDIVFEVISQENSVESFDSYFATQTVKEKAKEEPQKQEEEKF